MAQLFIQDQDGSRDWSVLPLTEDLYRISVPRSEAGLAKRVARAADSLPVPVVEPTRMESITRQGALLLQQADSSNDANTVTNANDAEPPATPPGWAILSGPDTRMRINGVAIGIGIATLRHRDEIGLDGGAPLYFSTERLATVETYPGSDSPRCARCTLPIEPEDLYVSCPDCSALHHQLPDRECFSYSPTCALCGGSNALAADFRWSPEGL